MPENSFPLPTVRHAVRRRWTQVGAAAAALLLAIGGALVGSAQTAARIRADAGEAALRAAREMADRLSTEMAARVREVDLLSQLDLFRNATADRAALRTTLAGLGGGLPAYAWIGLTDADGRVVAGTGGLLEDQSIAARPVFRNGRRGPWTGDVHEAVLLAAYAPRRPGEPAPRFVDVAAPVRASDGSLRGVLALHLSWQWAGTLRDKVLKAQGGPPTLRLEVIGSDGTVLLAPTDDPAPRPALPLALVRQLDDRWQAVPWDDGVVTVGASAPSRPGAGFRGFGWRVVGHEDPRATEAAIAAAERRIWQWSLGGGAVFAALVAWLVGSGLAPRAATRGADPPTARADRRKAAAEVASTFARLRASVGDAPAGTDAVTGLPNRDHLSTVADALNRTPDATAIELAVLCLDLDDFRSVNERFGRPAGDAALRQVAARLKAAAREDDIVLRLGGDEFVVVAPCAAGSGDATTGPVATRLLEQMRRPFSGIAPSVLVLGGCIGTACWRPGKASLLESVAHAGEALMAAKRAGRGQLRHYAARRGLGARRVEAQTS